MKKLTKVILVLAVVLAGASALAAQIAIGIRIGPPPPPRVIHVVPERPGPDFVWVTGYWYPVAGHYRWHEGYWTRPPYPGARWVAARHDGERFYEGYWEGDRGRVEHDHRWDHDRERDRHWDHDNGRGHAYGREKHERDDRDRDDHDR
ncbi:MAG TPA: hypothetical protein VFB23_01955 [Candidatus Acidoferrales bacterium]|nr:hypothetical protein [Candidatus Acidoferrales bacterium]